MSDKKTGKEALELRRHQIEVGKKFRELCEAGVSNKDIGKELNLSESQVRMLRNKHGL